jgi:hypothetical protein
MNEWALFLGIMAILNTLLILFVIFAQKGRLLRQRHEAVAPKIKHAVLQWIQNGERKEVEVVPPFYFGNSPESNIVLPRGRVRFEACIFFHNQRFALQSLEGAGEIQVNGQEMMAGYLADGDQLTLGESEFIFRCS